MGCTQGSTDSSVQVLPHAPPSQWSPQYFQFLRTLLFSLLSKILGLYCSTLCILPAAVTVRRAAGRQAEGVQWTQYHPLQALLLPLEEKVPLPWLLGTWGPLLLPWSLPLWDDLGAGTQKERWKNAYFSLSCSLSLNWRAFLAYFFHASVSTSSF